MIKLKSLGVKLLKLSLYGISFRANTILGYESHQKHKLMEMERWFHGFSFLVHHWLNHRSLIICILFISIGKHLIIVKIILSVGNWRQRLFNEFVETLNIHDRGDQMVVSAQFQE